MFTNSDTNMLIDTDRHRKPSDLRSTVSGLPMTSCVLFHCPNAAVHCPTEIGRRIDSNGTEIVTHKRTSVCKSRRGTGGCGVSTTRMGRHGDANPLTTPSALHFKRAIRRSELRQIVPHHDLRDGTAGSEFPRRFYLTPRCVVWDLAEVEAWIEQRRRASDADMIKRAPSPDVRQRKTRPVRQ